MFERIRERVIEMLDYQNKKDFALIEHGHETIENKDCYLEIHSTDTRWNQYQNGTIDRAKAVKLATDRARKENVKRTNKYLSALDAAQVSETIKNIFVTVEWKRNYCWGHNPRVTVNAGNMITYGYASGYGYDKESAAIANAFNSNPSILKELYLIKENSLNAGISDASDSCTGISNTACCGYGAGYCVVPYFEGGVGSECFWRILEKRGFEVFETRGKNETHYVITRKENENV